MQLKQLHKSWNKTILEDFATDFGYTSFTELATNEPLLADTLGQQVYDMSIREKNLMVRRINKRNNG